jgi:hypothetical protein
MTGNQMSKEDERQAKLEEEQLARDTGAEKSPDYSKIKQPQALEWNEDTQSFQPVQVPQGQRAKFYSIGNVKNQPTKEEMDAYQANIENAKTGKLHDQLMQNPPMADYSHVYPEAAVTDLQKRASHIESLRASAAAPSPRGSFGGGGGQDPNQAAFQIRDMYRQNPTPEMKAWAIQELQKLGANP